MYSLDKSQSKISKHDDVIKWKRFPRYWPFVRGIHRLPVNSPHKGQWRVALMFSVICAWINCWVNNREAGVLRRHRAHYDVIVMISAILFRVNVSRISPVCSASSGSSRTSARWPWLLSRRDFKKFSNSRGPLRSTSARIREDWGSNPRSASTRSASEISSTCRYTAERLWWRTSNILCGQ